MLGHSVAALAFTAAGAQYASAQVTSIFLPDFDSQPISITEVGVGSDGKTTFLLGAGTPTASGEEVGIPTSASITYVAGPSDVAWYANIDGQSASEVCTVGADGNAVCVASGGDQAFTNGFTTTVPFTAAYPVQFAGATGASTAAGASNTGGTSSGSNVGSASQTSKAASGASASGSSPASASPTNGASAFASSGLAALSVPAVLVALFSSVF